MYVWSLWPLAQQIHKTVRTIAQKSLRCSVLQQCVALGWILFWHVSFHFCVSFCLYVGLFWHIWCVKGYCKWVSNICARLIYMSKKIHINMKRDSYKYAKSTSVTSFLICFCTYMCVLLHMCRSLLTYLHIWCVGGYCKWVSSISKRPIYMSKKTHGNTESDPHKYGKKVM